ncbi:hypothetical protein ENSA5_52870 [Enhygromyxa salina]|uniref:Glycerophosphoryl diester phosphodiesterase membrane domain-containing protein n=1 Tax=Enhygromyxa salina TaxID=215803 RepID=A0A2S9XFU1_9BACT|nr:hypothetical protein [Enhygromyxa salina]PRP91707.1 hypothetical protein ENSA5_52870 [Enhygromyxa salina]
MKLDEARVVLRPRNLSEIFDLALRFATDPAAKLYAKLGALTLLPAWGLTLAARWGLGWDWGLVWLLALALVTPIQGVFTVAVGRMMFAEEVSVAEVLGQYLRRLPAYIGALFVTRVMIGVMSLGFFLVIPPLWMWGRCTYIHEACLLEQAGPVEAVSRASRMINRNVMSAVALLLMLTLAAAAFVFVAESLLNDGLLEFVLQVGRPFGSLFDEGGSAAALLGLFLAVPYWATVRFLAYVDLRTRRDGWDVQLRFMAIQAAIQASGAAAAESRAGLRVEPEGARA